MRTLNRAFRGKGYATDVLAFPVTGDGVSPPVRAGSKARLLPESAAYLGDIVIATGVAARQADDAGHPLATELRILALHGLLHLLGYDHESDDGRMARAEARLRKKGGLREGGTDRGGPAKAR
jgi:probable rRNA maturation factor